MSVGRKGHSADGRTIQTCWTVTRVAELLLSVRTTAAKAFGSLSSVHVEGTYYGERFDGPAARVAGLNARATVAHAP